MSIYQPIDFKWRHFHGEVIMQCVCWYCKYGISYHYLMRLFPIPMVLIFWIY